MGWCEVVPGSVTTTGATLRTYVYEVWEMLPGLPPPLNYLGYFPSTPANVQLAYTALGNLPPAAPQNLYVSSVGGHPKLVWNANGEPDLDHYNIWIKYTTCD